MDRAEFYAKLEKAGFSKIGEEYVKRSPVGEQRISISNDGRIVINGYKVKKVLSDSLEQSISEDISR